MNWTIYYKDVAIHGHTRKKECRFWWDEWKYARTLLGAKRAITKYQARLVAQAERLGL